MLEAGAVHLLAERLLALAEVLTPNVDEAAALTGMEVSNREQMKAAARRLLEMGSRAVVITGGHLDPATDLLSFHGPGGVEEHVFEAEHLSSSCTHGTGCAFSTALACNLAGGTPLPLAVSLAKAYVTAAIARAYPLGKGSGPVSHMFGLRPSGA